MRIMPSSTAHFLWGRFLTRVIKWLLIYLFMLPKQHFMFGAIASLVLYFVFPEFDIFNWVLFLMSSILIDVDHYLYYVYRKKDWNLGNAVRWFFDRRNILIRAGGNFRNNVYSCFCFLHGFEILAVFVSLGYFVWYGFYFVFLGILFHLILDYIDQITYRARFDKVSIIWDFFRYRRLVFIEDAIGLK